MRNLKANKKGQIAGGGIMSIVGIVLALVIAGVALVIGQTLNGNLQTQQTAGSYAYNSTVFVGQGLNTVAQQLPLIAIVAALGVVLAVLFFFMGGFIGGGRGRY